MCEHTKSTGTETLFIHSFTATLWWLVWEKLQDLPLYEQTQFVHTRCMHAGIAKWQQAWNCLVTRARLVLVVFFWRNFRCRPVLCPTHNRFIFECSFLSGFALWPCPSSKKKIFRCSCFFSGSVFSLRTHIRAVELHNMLGDDEVRSRLDAQSGCWSESLACAVCLIYAPTERDFLDSNFSRNKKSMHEEEKSISRIKASRARGEKCGFVILFFCRREWWTTRNEKFN